MLKGISIVVPVYNNQAGLEELHRQLHKELENFGRWEIIFVDDGSTDNSWEVLKSATRKCSSCVGAQFGANCGQNLATCEGILLSKHELIVTMDDDLQHSPSWIPQFVDYMNANQGVDAVFARPKNSGHGWARTIGSRFVNLIRRSYFGPTVPYFSAFRILRRKLALRIAEERLVAVSVSSVGYRFSTKIHNLDVMLDERRVGKSGYTFGRLVSTLVNNLRFSVTILGSGFAVSLVGLGLSFIGVAGYTIAFLVGAIGQPGFTTLAVLSIISVGLQFGILATVFKAQGDTQKTQSFRPLVRDSFGFDKSHDQ